MGVKGGHRDLAVSTIARFAVFIVQLNFLHSYPRDRQPQATLRTADSKQLEEQQFLFYFSNAIQGLNYSDIERLAVKGERQLITWHHKGFRCAIYRNDTKQDVPFFSPAF